MRERDGREVRDACLPEADAPGSAYSIVRVRGNVALDVQDEVAVEEPLEIRLTHGPEGARECRPISVTMRTPGHDAELAVGFLVSEGIVDDPGQIVSVEAADDAERAAASGCPVPQNVVHVALEKDVVVRPLALERNFYTTSSCGVCGKASLLALRSVSPPRRDNRLHVEAALLHSLPERMRAAQAEFSSTGGVHAAALFDANGERLTVREDVGRHNAVDKLVGSEFLADRTPLRESILMLSGRMSFELLQKAVMAGIPVVASVGAPSSMAVAIAREFDITMVGFVRDGRFNVYNGAERISGLAAEEVCG